MLIIYVEVTKYYLLSSSTQTMQVHWLNEYSQFGCSYEFGTFGLMLKLCNHIRVLNPRLPCLPPLMQ